MGLWLCVCLTGVVRADTFQLLDGSTLTGEIILPANADGVNIKVSQNNYQRVAWTNLTQATLQELIKDSRLAPFAEPYIEISDEERLKKTEVVIKPPPRLERPPKGSLLGALFGSSVGMVVMVLLYAANIYAGYEISQIRAYSPGMVCGIAAVAPVIGPILFLCLPTRMEAAPADSAEETPPAEAAAAGEPGNTASAAASADGTVEPAHAGGLSLARPQAAPATAAPAPQVFQRGQFTFNRRFIETKFVGFFGIVRRDADKDMVLQIKSVRGEFTVNRITRIAANDMHVEIRKGAATSEVSIAFAEIQEIRLKHKDA
ncbi:MAG: hypothetical protein KIS67_21200 [Verrucomicrobiae bacterium]|nr:hypothetical protein [Verrucomicrobiae bacterium]